MRKTPKIPQDILFEDKPKKTAKRQAVKQSSSQKSQVTVYLTDQAINALEKCKFELLTKHGLRVSKSAIAEYAITRSAGDVDDIAKTLGA